MIVNENLSPELFTILLEIFHRFDKDKDDCLSNDELSFFVFSTNGEHPSEDFLRQMGERFGANELGWLTKEGFLVNRYSIVLYIEIKLFLYLGFLFRTNTR